MKTVIKCLQTNKTLNSAFSRALYTFHFRSSGLLKPIHKIYFLQKFIILSYYFSEKILISYLSGSFAKLIRLLYL